MNPGQFNKRVQFLQITYVKNEFGGTTPNLTPILTTWGALTPYREYRQSVMQAGATTLESNIVLKIRYRDSFQPNESMKFRDVSDSDDVNSPIYSIVSVLPYYPGAKLTFENNQETVYQDRLFRWIVGTKEDNSYLNIHS
jgi:SPP1 family predicted phage head-tail adaptor